MKKLRRIIHVRLIDPQPPYKEDYYFGSVAAVYDTLPKEIVGISKMSVWNSLRKCDVYNGKKAVIKRGKLYTKDTNRGRKETE